MTHLLNETDRTLLLRIARESIAARAGGQTAPAVAATPALRRPAGAFVTIHRQGQLRGCIGHIEADRPLVDTVASCAVAASAADPRFPAVTAAELPGADLEISVLGPLERISCPEEVEVGRHGLLVEWGVHRGLLLPQVATEQGWDARTFIAQACRKAGLPADAWENGATLWRFEAEVFDENRTANRVEGTPGEQD